MNKFSTELSVEKRRWVVVGLCLHSVVIPRLRGIISREVSKVYEEMKSKKNPIDKQTSSKYQKTMPKDWKCLNYRNINGNHLKKEDQFDYKVKDDVSLAKLLMEHMAKFNAFDNSFDASAALTVLSTPGFFNDPVNVLAGNVNSVVRNEWAHPRSDFAEWTENKYDKCFSFLEELVKVIPGHDPEWKEEELSINCKLCWWKKYGPTFCLGKGVPEDNSFRECLNEVKAFSKNFADFRETVSEEVDRQTNETYDLFESLLNSVVNPFIEKQDSLEKDLKEEIKLRKDGDKKLNASIKTVTSMVASLEGSHVKLAEAFAKTENEPEKQRKQQEEQISELFESFTMDLLEREKRKEVHVIHLSNKLKLLEEQQKALQTKFCEMEKKNEQLEAKVHEQQIELEAFKTANATQAFEAPPSHSGFGLE